MRQRLQEGYRLTYVLHITIHTPDQWNTYMELLAATGDIEEVTKYQIIADTCPFPVFFTVHKLQIVQEQIGVRHDLLYKLPPHIARCIHRAVDAFLTTTYQQTFQFTGVYQRLTTREGYAAAGIIHDACLLHHDGHHLLFGIVTPTHLDGFGGTHSGAITTEKTSGKIGDDPFCRCQYKGICRTYGDAAAASYTSAFIVKFLGPEGDALGIMTPLAG